MKNKCSMPFFTSPLALDVLYIFDKRRKSLNKQNLKLSDCFRNSEYFKRTNV